MPHLYRPLRALALLRALAPLLPLALLLPACDAGDSDGDDPITRVTITEVEVENVPLLQDDGDDWDEDFGTGVGQEPDVYFELVNDDTGSPILSDPPAEFGDVEASDLPIVWSATPGSDEEALEEIEFTRFGTPLAFDLYDADPQLTKGDDDFMGSTEPFTIQDLVDQTTPPTLFTVQSADGEISIRIRLSYER